jgi:hypothetical protein
MRNRAKVTYWPGAVTPLKGLMGSKVWTAALASGALVSRNREKLARKVLCACGELLKMLLLEIRGG